MAGIANTLALVSKARAAAGELKGIIQDGKVGVSDLPRAFTLVQVLVSSAQLMPQARVELADLDLAEAKQLITSTFDLITDLYTTVKAGLALAPATATAA